MIYITEKSFRLIHHTLDVLQKDGREYIHVWELQDVGTPAGTVQPNEGY